MQKAVVSVCLSVGVLVGCSRQQDIPVPQDEVQEAELLLEQMQLRVNAIAAESGIPTALAFGVTEMADWDNPYIQQDAFYGLVSLAQQTDDPDVISAFVKDLIVLDENMAGQAVMLFDGQMMEADSSAWLGFLTDESMPSTFRMHGHRLWFRHYGEDASMQDVTEAVLALLDPVLEKHVGGLLSETLQHVLVNRDAREIWDLLGSLQAHIPSESSLYEIVVHTQVQAYLRDAMMPEAFAHYQEHVALLGDVRVAPGVSRLLDHAASEGDLAFRARILAWGYGLEDFSMTRTRIARWELAQLRAEEDVSVVVDGVRAVMGRGVPVTVIANAFVREILYPTLARADTEEQQELRDVLLEMLVADEDLPEFVRASLKSSLLDVYFYLEDYRAALQQIEAGVPGYDADWHAELGNKVQAHLAEQEGRIADAVAHYKEHIQRVKTWTDSIVSPEDGRNILPYEVIALNERRISDLWAGEGETEKADAARARAITYYRLARDAYADDAQSFSKMEQVLQEMEAE